MPVWKKDIEAWIEWNATTHPDWPARYNAAQNDAGKMAKRMPFVHTTGSRVNFGAKDLVKAIDCTADLCEKLGDVEDWRPDTGGAPGDTTVSGADVLIRYFRKAVELQLACLGPRGILAQTIVDGACGGHSSVWDELNAYGHLPADDAARRGAARQALTTTLLNALNGFILYDNRREHLRASLWKHRAFGAWWRMQREELVKGSVAHEVKEFDDLLATVDAFGTTRRMPPRWAALRLTRKIVERVFAPAFEFSHVPFTSLLMSQTGRPPCLHPQGDASSPGTRAAQLLLKEPDAIFFYAGRGHPSFGEISLAFAPPERCADGTDMPGFANPFDSGGVIGEHISLSLPHAERSKRRAAFVRRTRCGIDVWRTGFTAHLAAFFPGASFFRDQPEYAAPCDIWQAARADRTQDWRAWTPELRLHRPLPLLGCLVFSATSDVIHALRDMARDPSPGPEDANPAARFLMQTTPDDLNGDDRGNPDHCRRLGRWIEDYVKS